MDELIKNKRIAEAEKIKDVAGKALKEDKIIYPHGKHQRIIIEELIGIKTTTNHQCAVEYIKGRLRNIWWAKELYPITMGKFLYSISGVASLVWRYRLFSLGITGEKLKSIRSKNGDLKGLSADERTAIDKYLFYRERCLQFWSS